MVYVGFLGQICLYKSPTMYLLHQIIFGTVYIQVSMTHVNHSALLHGYLHLKAFNELASYYFYNAWPSNPQLSSSLHACKKLHTTLCIRIIANIKNLNSNWKILNILANLVCYNHRRSIYTESMANSRRFSLRGKIPLWEFLV